PHGSPPRAPRTAPPGHPPWRRGPGPSPRTGPRPARRLPAWPAPPAAPVRRTFPAFSFPPSLHHHQFVPVDHRALGNGSAIVRGSSPRDQGPEVLGRVRRDPTGERPSVLVGHVHGVVGTEGTLHADDSPGEQARSPLYQGPFRPRVHHHPPRSLQGEPDPRLLAPDPPSPRRDVRPDLGPTQHPFQDPGGPGPGHPH